MRPHRPPTKSGKTVVFVTLADETGLLDVTVFEDTYQRYGGVIYTEFAILVESTMTFSRGASLIADRIGSLRTHSDEAETLAANATPDNVVSRCKPSRG